MKLISKEFNQYTDGLEHWYWDDVAEKMVIKSTFNVGDIISANKNQQNKTIDQRFGNERMHHVAEIPNSVVTKFKTDYNIDVFSEDATEQKRLRRKLESPEWRYLKTTVSKLWRPT